MADNYADAAPPAATAPTDKPEESTESPQEQDDGAQTAEIPKSAFGGRDIKPGDKCEFEAVQVLEDSVLVKYASEKEEGEEAPPSEAEPATPPAMGGGNYE